MFESVLRNRLTTLYADLTCTSKEALSLIAFMDNSIDDKTKVIKDMYYHDHAPVRVLNTEFRGTGGTFDIEEELITVSEGYDRFLKKIGNQTANVMNKHTRALNLLFNLLALPDPYCRILYLRFFKGFTVEKVSEIMFISKTSCYRKQEQGIHLLYERINSMETQTV